MINILIIYYSKNGSTKKMVKYIANGIESIPKAKSNVLPVHNIKYNKNYLDNIINLIECCDGILIGSPSYFGNMASSLKKFLEKISSLWFSNSLVGKPAGIFTSSKNIHGGNEATLLSMMIPLLHYGMIISGIPYSCKELNKTITGGTPYGASHFSGNGNKNISYDEKKICEMLGRRVTELALKMK